jgi:hypothetical protein
MTKQEVMQRSQNMNPSLRLAAEAGKGGGVCIKRDNRRSQDMKMEQWIRAIAGTFILISLGLGYFVNPYWFLFTAFVGLNLVQSAFTNWCLMENLLEKLGIARKC